ncbi:YehS family protein [Psychrobacillus sp. FSL K6-1267]|uniref:DUF1456 family protein n=1 Tax=Psychrobacillus sp. FSL K6-1267 TaxID=2921543 RepID=UPI0012B0F4B6|nr:DUF1456 family protein [Bacillus sp. N3536]
MENNDILIRLRYALDIKNKEMVEIFKLGGVEISKEDVLKLLTKSKDSFESDYDESPEEEDNQLKCNNKMLESFLNGLITFKRGPQEQKQGQQVAPPSPSGNSESVNNMLMKKVKIALALTSEDMIDILEESRVAITKSELSAILRKEGHRNYKECGDKFARNFLKGLAIKYRGI